MHVVRGHSVARVPVSLLSISVASALSLLPVAAPVLGQVEAARDSIAVSRGGATCTTVPGAELVELAPGATLTQALRGRVAGLQVATPSGWAGAGTSVVSRGNRSTLGPTEPIVFVDGVRLTPMKSGPTGYQAVQFLDLIDPADVARVEILRGPAATALYGTEASGGVIHVFIKHGSPAADRGSDPKSSCIPS